MGLFDKLRRPRKVELSLSREAADLASDHLMAMDDALEELAALPGLEAFAHTRKLPARFFELWDEALAAYDRYLELMSGPRGLDVSCKPGCAACCHENPTGVQAVELLAIYAVYRGFEDFAELHNRACDQNDELVALLAKEAPDRRAVASDSPEYQRAHLSYRQLRRPCVFLDGEQRCRIYARRPLTCRMHVATTDPSLCWIDHPKAGDAVTPHLQPPKDMLAYMKTIAERLGLELPATLFGGLGMLGGQVMQTRRLRIIRS